MNILLSSKGIFTYKRSYKAFPFAKTKEIKNQNVQLQVTHLGAKVEPLSRKGKISEPVPTAKISGLNFPVEKREEYYKNQTERRASIAACHISPETSPFFENRY